MLSAGALGGDARPREHGTTTTLAASQRNFAGED